MDFYSSKSQENGGEAPLFAVNLIRLIGNKNRQNCMCSHACLKGDRPTLIRFCQAKYSSEFQKTSYCIYAIRILLSVFEQHNTHI